MQPYLVPLITLFQENANPDQAGPMKKYMRDQFEYLGNQIAAIQSNIQRFH